MGVGENIKKIRESKRLKQTEVAEQAGITQSMLCQIEKGIKNPSLIVGKEIADALGVEVNKLFE